MGGGPGSVGVGGQGGYELKKVFVKMQKRKERNNKLNKLHN